jgi:hypothetical protein
MSIKYGINRIIKCYNILGDYMLLKNINYKKIIMLLLIGIIISPIIVNASMYFNIATEINLTFNNIDEEYDKVLIMKNGTNADLKTIVQELGIENEEITEDSVYSYVSPFEKEDFVFDNKLKEKYTIKYKISYTYEFETREFESSEKYNNIEELIKHEVYNSEKAKEMREHPDDIKCKRQIRFEVYALEKVKDASSYITNSSNSSLSIKLTNLNFLSDSTSLSTKTIPGSILYIRFVKKDGTTKDFEIGSKIIRTFGHPAKPEELIKNYIVDYQTGSIIDAKDSPVKALLSNPMNLVKGLLFAAFLSVLMSYIELLTFPVNKRKELLVKFILINVALFICCFYSAPILGETKMLAIGFIVFFEFVAHAIKLELYRLSINEKKFFSYKELPSVLISISILIFSILLFNLLF